MQSRGCPDRRPGFRYGLLCGAAACALAATATVPTTAATLGPNDANTKTPIKHVIIIVGENRSFDHVFATYVPPNGTVVNMLSEGIIDKNGKPGPNFDLAQQYSAVVNTTFTLAPGGKKLYTMGKQNMPPVMTGGAPEFASNTNPPPFATVAAAKMVDSPALPAGYYVRLTTGATGLPADSIDTRYPNAATPINGPYQLSPHISYDDYAASPVHRFYQMWQQLDCSAAHATTTNPTGCLADLFPWVEASVGTGSNGAKQPPHFTNQTTGEGSASMGFYNVQHGDMPYFKMLADTYALGDNYHQPVKGGTGADSVYLGYAADVWYTNSKGGPGVPPTNQIENPNPQKGTNNWYTQDGYSGGSYSDCSDAKQPGVSEIVAYLGALSYKPDPNCQPGRYYLLNNYNPGYFGDGKPAPLGPTVYTIPPQSQLSIANVLDKAGVSWTYYGEAWNAYVSDPTAGLGETYCNICNPFLYQTYVMTNKKERTTHLKDTIDLYADLKSGTLPAVSWVKPDSFNDGHPASSKYDIFEPFVKKILDMLMAKPALWATTAVMITNDEGGGYYDSGFVQAVDFFGDGTRIPMIVVSPYSKGVGMVHGYGDHASFIKFVDANWGLKPIASYTRDNLPNPTVSAKNPYVPTNMPALDDMMDYFNFSKK
jgi:phospholipase C